LLLGYYAWLPTAVAYALGYRAWRIRCDGIKELNEPEWIATITPGKSYRGNAAVCLVAWFVCAILAAIIMGRRYYSWGAAVAAITFGFELWRTNRVASEDPHIFAKQDYIAGNGCVVLVFTAMALVIFALPKSWY
jgi:hypothetical protein